MRVGDLRPDRRTRCRHPGRVEVAVSSARVRMHGTDMPAATDEGGDVGPTEVEADAGGSVRSVTDHLEVGAKSLRSLRNESAS